MRIARLPSRLGRLAAPAKGWVARVTNSCNVSRALLHSSALSQKIVHFNLPDIGEGIAEVEVLKWHVKEGDRVAQFDKIMEVQSDKATVDITSRYDGVVTTLHYKVGDMAPTGKPLLDIEVDDSAGHEAAAPAAAKAAAAAPAPTAAAGAAAIDANSPRALATPAVRRIAREHGVAVTSLNGTGKDGRVTKEDILKHVSGGAAADVAAPPARTGAGAPASSGGAAPAPAVIPPPLTISTAPPRDQRMPLKGLQRAMVKSMVTAWEVPHFGYCDEVVMDNLMAARQQLKHAADKRGLKVTYLPLILKATSLALAEFPLLNASVAPDGQEMVLRGPHNIGVAMDTPRGLIVPNIKSVQDRSVLDIAHELARLQALAQLGKLGEADLGDTTFSISNIGTVGGTYASPVIMPPNVAIGAIGKIMKLPRYASTLPGAVAPKAGAAAAGDALVPAHIMTVSWAADHRVVDGATMARFSNVWKKLLEEPYLMLAGLR